MAHRRSAALTGLLSRCLAVLFAIAMVTAAGCPREAAKPAAPSSPKPRASLTLRVLVVNEPELAKAIERLRGEWAERSGGELEATATTWPELAKAEKIDADVLVFPSRYLGELCVQGRLRPVRASVLEGEDYDSADVLPVVQRSLAKFGGQAMAVPMGVVLADASDLAEKPGVAFLNAAAASVVSEDRLGVLFDTETMKPRITEPEFVAALTELAGLAGDGGTTPAASIPVLGFDDRLAGVSAGSRNAASAFKLLEWLASAEISAQLASTKPGLLPVRQSLTMSPKWYGAALTAGERRERGKQLEELLTQQRDFVVPAIPGIDDYLAALDAAVNSVIKEKVAPTDALAKAAAEWEAITDRIGREKQREAYLKHLGLEE